MVMITCYSHPQQGSCCINPPTLLSLSLSLSTNNNTLQDGAAPSLSIATKTEETPLKGLWICCKQASLPILLFVSPLEDKTSRELKQPKLSEELHRRKKTNKPKPLNERLS
jgi:hypothetical protein